MCNILIDLCLAQPNKLFLSWMNLFLLSMHGIFRLLFKIDFVALTLRSAQKVPPVMKHGCPPVWTDIYRILRRSFAILLSVDWSTKCYCLFKLACIFLLDFIFICAKTEACGRRGLKWNVKLLLGNLLSIQKKHLRNFLLHKEGIISVNSFVLAFS